MDNYFAVKLESDGCWGAALRDPTLGSIWTCSLRCASLDGALDQIGILCKSVFQGIGRVEVRDLTNNTIIDYIIGDKEDGN